MSSKGVYNLNGYKQINKDLYEGLTFDTKFNGKLEIVEYISNKNVVVKFVDTGYVTQTALSEIQRGSVKDRLRASIFGVGIIGEEPSCIDGKELREYILWTGVLERCYCPRAQSTNSKAYIGCSVSDNFRYYPYFKEWCNRQIGFDQDGWHLDKDILVKGNKIYSEDVCVFVPHRINSLLLTNESKRGEHPIGVTFDKRNSKFRVCINKYGKNSHVGHYRTIGEASLAYKDAKEMYVKEVATSYRDQIDPRVYKALMVWEVEEERQS